jgi:hypothetical protein
MEKEYVKTATEDYEFQALFTEPSRLSRIYEEIRNENPDLDEVTSLRIANTVLSNNLDDRSESLTDVR